MCECVSLLCAVIPIFVVSFVISAHFLDITLCLVHLFLLCCPLQLTLVFQPKLQQLLQRGSHLLELHTG